MESRPCMKVFVITDANGKILCEQMAEFAHVALKAAKDEHSNAKTAIVKEEWQREHLHFAPNLCCGVGSPWIGSFVYRSRQIEKS